MGVLRVTPEPGSARMGSMITTVAVANYRSLHDVRINLGALTVVTGANGSGKSSLYRALRLLAACARGDVVASLAREGGLPSALWAGPEAFGTGVRSGELPVQGTRRTQPVSLLLGFASDGFGYVADLGLPIPSDSAFGLDPEIKREAVWSGPTLRPAATLVRRNGPLVEVRNDGGDFEPVTDQLRSFDSALAEIGDPRRSPELLAVREQLRGWRFYDGFRADADAPARRTQIGTRTPVLSDDGRDLAAALQTIREIGAAMDLDRAVDDAFPGSRLEVVVESGRFDLTLRQPGLLRGLRTAELSDGTLRFLLWVAALLSPRPGQLMVLNEPETSLHPDLLPALGRLVAAASSRTQVVVVTHDPALVAQLEAVDDMVRVELVKELGETRAAGSGRFDQPPWSWGSR
jgi:predicted ATPase